MPASTSLLRGWAVNACSSLVSEKHSPTASTCSTSWWGPGTGTGFVRLWTTSLGPVNWIACWVAGRLVKGAAPVGCRVS